MRAVVSIVPCITIIPNLANFLIAVAPDTITPPSDNADGNVAWEYLVDMKALATVGEVDKDTGYPMTGWPDGNAAWLLDDSTVRV